jgi:UDP-galactopyranose mutase
MELSPLLCFSHLRWNFVWQRPQHLMTLASQMRDVWFVEEPEEEDGPPALDLRSESPRLTVVVPRLPRSLNRKQRVRVQHELLDELVATLDAPPLHWYYTPMAREFASTLPAGPIVYDCMDELSAFAGAPAAMRVWEAELLAAADVVFTGGASLYEAKRCRHPKVLPFPSAVDVDHFKTARLPLPEHEAQRAIASPRIGFAGVLDERLDRELLAAIAGLRPDYQFVLAGPVVKISADALPQAPNLHYLGMQPYRELPRLMSGWDVAILPFARNDATRYISPTKTPEYLAAGRPVVSTSIRDVVRPYGELGLVQIADEPERFVECLDRALADRSGEWLENVDGFLSKMSWERTWRQMHSHLLQAEMRRRPVLVARSS